MGTYTVSVQGYGSDPAGPVLVWDSHTSEITDDAAVAHWVNLRARRRAARRNVADLPDGIEFDSYGHGFEPPGCPELVGSRTRVTFVLDTATAPQFRATSPVASR